MLPSKKSVIAASRPARSAEADISLVLTNAEEFVVESEAEDPFVASEEVLPDLFDLARFYLVLLAVEIGVSLLPQQAAENVQLTLAVAEIDDVMGGNHSVGEQFIDNLTSPILAEKLLQLLREFQGRPHYHIPADRSDDP
ncbi:UNVERIFIED_ORG: GTP1/Obg family GTP-binding protein [Rhizobium sp. SORGH_AS 755]|nr:GTP1/Obg family GTP-binding protein [Rhizobium sp. SORGH_AS_0755]